MVAVREAPRIERLPVPAALLVPCPKATRGGVDPDSATGLDVSGLLIVTAGLNDACAAKHQALTDLLRPIVDIKGD